MEDEETNTPDDEVVTGVAGEDAGDGSTTSGDGGAGAAGDTGTDGTQSTDTDDDDPATWDKDRAKRTIERQRKSESEALALARANQAKADAFDKLEREKLSKEEQLTGDLAKRDETIDKLTQRIQSLTIDTKLTGSGIPDKRLKAARAILEVEYDDAGEPTNLDDAIAALKEEHGYLFDGDQGDDGGDPPPKKREGSANAGRGSRKGDSSDVVLDAGQIDLARRAGMTNDEYIKYSAPQR